MSSEISVGIAADAAYVVDDADAQDAPDSDSLPTFDSLTGWGRTAPTTALLVRPRSYGEAAAAVRASGAPGARGSIARGLGRAPGDAARNAGGSVLDMTGLDLIRAIDAENGVVVCDAGVSLHRLAEVMLPLGWSVPALHGSRRVTVGGAVAGDLHGRDHQVAGTFSRHVASIELLTADGTVRTVAPGTVLFDATAGGMGLTGVILSVTLRTHPVSTPLLAVDTERAAGLDDLLSRLSTRDDRYRYSTAWVDLLARGPSLGRAVLIRSAHVDLNALPAHARRNPFALRPGGALPGWAHLPSAALSAALPGRRRAPGLPQDLVPDGLLGRRAARILNEMRFRAAPAHRIRRIRPLTDTADGLPRWNRIYGRSGFVQYEFVVGLGQEETLHRIVRRVARRGCPTLVATVKRLGAAGHGMLSFPMPGWALALEVPASLPGLGSFLDELDEEVAGAGGRVSLANDARLRPELLAAMYPRLEEFRALRAALDPSSVLTSDLSRRLSL